MKLHQCKTSVGEREREVKYLIWLVSPDMPIWVVKRFQHLVNWVRALIHGKEHAINA